MVLVFANHDVLSPHFLGFQRLIVGLLVSLSNLAENRISQIDCDFTEIIFSRHSQTQCSWYNEGTASEQSNQ
jgi:hypothetical protein